MEKEYTFPIRPRDDPRIRMAEPNSSMDSRCLKVKILFSAIDLFALIGSVVDQPIVTSASTKCCLGRIPQLLNKTILWLRRLVYIHQIAYIVYFS